jgi:hypothetical protein
MPPEPKRKPRPQPAPYNRQKEKQGKKDAPSTSAKPIKAKRDNLTLRDWMTVFAFVDAHQSMPQAQVVTHFKTRQDSALVFDQSTLSRKLKERGTLESRARDDPTALSSKRARIVTRPEPTEERISESDLMFELEGGDEEIVEQVQHQIAVDNGEVMVVDSESDGDNEVESEPKLSTAEIMTMCQQLEGVCREKMGGSDCVYHLSQNLRRFRGYLRREELKNAKQMTLDQFFSSSATRM